MEYIHSSDYVKTNLKQTNDDKIVCLKPCSIHLPTSYRAKEMASIGTTITIIGVHGLIMGDKYAVNLTNSMMVIKPTSTNIIKINGEDYYEFNFEAGSVVYDNINLVMSDDNPYNIFNQIYDYGKVPWYIEENSYLLSRVLNSSKKFTGVQYGSNPNIIGMITSHMLRDPNNSDVFFRHTLKTQEDVFKMKPKIYGFRNVGTGTNNTTSALMGNYFREATTSALLKPATREEPLENILGN